MACRRSWTPRASSDDVKSLGGDVTGVKTDLETTKNNLQMARGEFGTLIAKNHDEIEELRRLGERDYYEFTISGKGNKTKMGTLTAELRDTNVKKNQFTMALYVDDMRLEKKNRSVEATLPHLLLPPAAPARLLSNWWSTKSARKRSPAAERCPSKVLRRHQQPTAVNNS